MQLPMNIYSLHCLYDEYITTLQPLSIDLSWPAKFLYLTGIFTCTGGWKEWKDEGFVEIQSP